MYLEKNPQTIKKSAKITQMAKSWTEYFSYSKAGLKRPLKKNTKNGFQYRLSLNAIQKYCRMLQESILQYFQPA